jgi:hypothetical protein
MVKAKNPDGAALAKLAKLIPIMREEHEKMGALIAEFEAIASGGPTIGDKLKEIEAHWADLWKWRYHEDFAWTDIATIRSQEKLLLKKLGGVDAVKARISNYIGNAAPGLVEKRHSWFWFIRTINDHVPVGEGADSLTQTPDGCKHVPPCRDQFEHTKKRQAEQTQ